MRTRQVYGWKDKIINFNQVGGIETAVLDNGSGKGVRIAWINTGGGLRYKVVIDRALDIADAFYQQHSLCWLSHVGTTSAAPDSGHGLEWQSAFGGGLMTTCGLSHVGGPESDQYGTRGPHGKISKQLAAVESIIQPDLAAGKLEMGITAIIKESKVFGPNLELRRTISSTIGRPQIRISDIVTNCGNTNAPHMILYHCNYGWPLIDEGTQIIWKGSCLSRGLEMDNAIFKKSENFKVCRKPLESHRGIGEACGFIDVKADRKGICNVGLYNRRLGFAVSMKYSKKQLPWLTNWQHWGHGEYVMGLEPGTNPPIGQKAAREQKTLIYLEPGQSRTYALEIEVLTEREQIKKLIS
ncbi:MAG: aldose 1-epimerase family protein [Sedimentisphaerales bacterium]|nr:aldose 1-epimerase family protein [Sedimentisphaerales bacterium]